MIVGTSVRGKTGATIGPSPGRALGSPEDTGGARVDIGGIGGGRDDAGGVTELMA